jgi:hypothetical protein
MHNIKLITLLSIDILSALSLWWLAPLTPLLVELFIKLQEQSYMNVTVSPTSGTMTSPFCRSVFPSMYQYTIEGVLRTAAIPNFFSRYSSVKCNFSKPFFRLSLHVTYSEHWIIFKVYKYFQYYVSILSFQTQSLHRYKRGGKCGTIFWMFLHEYSQIIKILYLTVAKWPYIEHRKESHSQYLAIKCTNRLHIFPVFYFDTLKHDYTKQASCL